MKRIISILFLAVAVCGYSQTAQTSLSNAVYFGYGNLESGDQLAVFGYGIMAPVGAGTASTALSNAIANGYGNLATGDKWSIIAYGAATGGTGSAGVLSTVYTTNTAAAVDLHVLAISGSPTNGITATSATNIALAVTAPIFLSTSNFLQSEINTNAANIGLATTTNGVKGLIASTLIASNYASITYANGVTNGYPWGVLYAPVTVTNLPFTPLTALQTTNEAVAAATAVTNGFPWGSLYAPAGSYATNLTAAANSYTTNLVIPSSQTSWSVVLPAAATNYLVTTRLFLKLTANNHGLSLSNGALLDTAQITGTTYICHPFSLTDTGDGKTFIVNSDGDYANFMDAGIPQHFQPSFVQSDFQIQAQFIYTVKK